MRERRCHTCLRLLYGATLACAGWLAGLTLTHVLQSAGSRTLTATQWLTVQHTFYGGFAIVGGIAEVVGFACAVALLLLRCSGRVERIVGTVTAVAFAVALTAYLVGNAPVNAAVATWTPETLPDEWRSSRDRWEAAHAIAAAAAAVAFTTLVVASALARRSDERDPKRG